MKLADSWKPIPVAVAAGFHDEAEVADEVDDDEDGWGWVDEYLLIEKGTSNRKLFDLARAAHGIALRRSVKWRNPELMAIFKRWQRGSAEFLGGGDYYVEFLAKMALVKIPKGECLATAFELAKTGATPEKVKGCGSSEFQQFAGLCRELSVMAGGTPIMLCQKAIAGLFGHRHHRNVSNWIHALRTLKVLQLAEAAITNKRAARYWYCE